MDTIYSTTEHAHFFRDLSTARKSLEDAGFVYQADTADFYNGEDANCRMTFIRPATTFFAPAIAYIGFSRLA